MSTHIKYTCDQLKIFLDCYTFDSIYLWSIDLESYKAFRRSEPDMTGHQLVAQSDLHGPK